jgi:hypothetical protein
MTVLSRFLAKLTAPKLFIFTVIVLVLDLLIPDVVPFIDEVFLAAATLLLARWRKRKAGKT